MTQNFFDVAVQTSSNEIIYTDCLDCGEPIQNLLCPNCIAKHFEQWLNKYPKLKNKILKQVKKFINAHNYDDYSTCSACGKNTVYNCPYCFIEYLFELLKEQNATSEALKSFFEFFNYDFGHLGYSQEINKLGVI